MSKVDWSSMSPEDVWASLKSAPRVAGPWEDPGGGYEASRRALDGTVVAVDGLWVTPDYPRTPWRVPNSGRENADAILREHGWVLA